MLLIALLITATVLAAWIGTRDTRLGGLSASALGFGCSAYLLWRKIDASGSALCNVSDTINCDVVNSSPSSELLGIPIALMGVGWFGGLLLAGAVPPKGLPRFSQVLALGSGLLLPWCLWLGVAAAQLGAVCVLCLTIYAAVGLGLWNGIRGARDEGLVLLDLGPAAASSSGTTAIGSWLVAIVLGRWFLPTPAGHTLLPPPVDVDVATYVAGHVFEVPGPLRLDGDEPSFGRSDATYTLVEFADFGCPHCAIAFQHIKQLVELQPDIKVRFRTFPLSGACNPVMEDFGPERCHAAAAAECAEKQGRFWEYAGLLFENQTHLGDEDLKFMAEQAGLDMAAWTTCVQDPATLGLVVADAMAGKDVGVTGTPSFFLKGPWGDRFVAVERIEFVPMIVDAHRAGKPMPTPGPPRRP